VLHNYNGLIVSPQAAFTDPSQEVRPEAVLTGEEVVALKCRRPVLANPGCSISADRSRSWLRQAVFEFQLADREGFEPPVQLPVRRISSAVLSTTQPPVQTVEITGLSRSGKLPRIAPVIPAVLIAPTRGASSAAAFWLAAA
jgi:hypothetical protein